MRLLNRFSRGASAVHPPNSPSRKYRIALLILGIHCCLINRCTSQGEQRVEDLTLDSLLNIKISAASKYAQMSSNAPSSVTVITSQDIAGYGYRNLEDVFNSVPGFYVSNDRNYTYVGVRGFSRPTDYNDRILLLLNGQTLNENVYGSAPCGNDYSLDLANIERIEIVRGPGSALYGTGAMFAVVNIVTKNGKSLNGFQIRGGMGSYGRREGGFMWGKELDNGTDILLSGQLVDIDGQDLYYREFDTDSTNHGVAVNRDGEKYYGLLSKISYKSFTLQGILMSREKMIPTASFGTLFNQSTEKTLDEQQHIDLKYDDAIGGNKYLMVRGNFNYYDYRGQYPYRGSDEFDATDGKWIGSEAQLRWDVLSYDRLIVGTEYRNNLHADYRYFIPNSLSYVVNVPYTVFSVFLQNEYQPLKNLSLTLGIRDDDYSTAGSSTNPRVAIVYNPIQKGTLKLLYGQAFRAPNLYELFYNDPINNVRANPYLSPEKIRTAEVVWEQRFTGEFFGTLSVYNYDIENLIEQDSSDNYLQFQNRSEAKANGIEVGLRTVSANGLRGDISFGLQSAKDASTSADLTNSPQRLLKARLEYPVFSDFSAAAEVLYESERITVYGTKTNAFFLTNLNFGIRPQVESDLSVARLVNRMRISLLVRNVFNTTYETPGGFEHVQPAIIQDGRTILARIEFQF